MSARCPKCERELGGLGTFCVDCGTYVDDPVELGRPVEPTESVESSEAAEPDGTAYRLPLPPSANDFSRSFARIRGMKAAREALRARDWAAMERALDALEAFVTVTTSQAGRTWQRDAEEWLSAQGCTPLAKSAPASVRAALYFPNNRRDLDNGIKPLLDVLQGFLLENDRQVHHVAFWKLFDETNPRTELQVDRAIPPPPLGGAGFQFNLPF